MENHLTWIKKNPTRIVSYMANSEHKEVPYIRLQGNWLNAAGFEIGSLFIAEVLENKIVLIKKEKV